MLALNRIPPSRSRSLRSKAVALGLGATCAILPSTSFAQGFTNYHVQPSFQLPEGSGAVGVKPSGEIVALVGSTVYVETASGSRQFSALGTLAGADLASFGPAFVRVSPNGSKLAVGNNGGVDTTNFQVGVFALDATLVGNWYTINHFDAAWIDNRLLAVSMGTFPAPPEQGKSNVIALDTTSDPASPISIQLVAEFTGASGGLAFDHAGNFFIGNGSTGAVRSFAKAERDAALASGGAPLNLDTQGKPILTLLSASPLQFDFEDNLLVGGSGAGQGFVGLVKAEAVDSAFAGKGQVDTSSTSTVVQRLDPDTANASNFYTVLTNDARKEFYVQDLSTPTTLFPYNWSPAAGPRDDTDSSCAINVAPVGTRSAQLGVLMLGAVLAFRRVQRPKARKP